MMVGSGGTPLGLVGCGGLGASGLLSMPPGAGGWVCAMAGPAKTMRIRIASDSLTAMGSPLRPSPCLDRTRKMQGRVQDAPHGRAFSATPCKLRTAKGARGIMRVWVIFCLATFLGATHVAAREADHALLHQVAADVRVDALHAT